MNSQEIVDYVMNTPYNTNPTILKQMIEENGGSSGGGTVNSVNDILPDERGNVEIGWNDLADRPFGHIYNKCTVLDAGQYNNASYVDVENKYFYENLLTIIYDGEKYELDSRSIMPPYWEVSYYYYGNLYLVFPEYGEDNGMPFCLGITENDPSLEIYFTDKNSHTLEAYYTTEVFKKLDEEFMPYHEHYYSWNDLEDKPLIEESGIGTLFPEQVIPIAGYDYRRVAFDKTLVLGETYTVTVDGVDYEIECVYNDEYSSQHQLIVNDNFKIYQEVDDSALFFDNSLESPVSYTISITGLTFSETLDPKYLPKAAAVADVANAPTAEDFNALLTALRDAGYLAI